MVFKFKEEEIQWWCEKVDETMAGIFKGAIDVSILHMDEDRIAITVDCYCAGDFAIIFSHEELISAKIPTKYFMNEIIRATGEHLTHYYWNLVEQD